jgi:hypothetical protein
MNGHASPQPLTGFPCLIDLGNRRRKPTGIFGHQAQSVCARRQHGKLPVSAGLTVPPFEIQASIRRRAPHRVLKIVLDLRLLCRVALAEPLDINGDKEPERQAPEVLSMSSSRGCEPSANSWHGATPPHLNVSPAARATSRTITAAGDARGRCAWSFDKAVLFPRKKQYIRYSV